MPTTLELAKAHLAAEDRQDIEATLATFTNDCVYEMSAFGIELRGKEAIRKHYASAFEAFPDFLNGAPTWYECGDDVFCTGRLAATHRKAWGPIPASGRILSMTAFVHFPRAPDGLLLGEIIYTNGNDFLAQMGALPSANSLVVADHIRQLEVKVSQLEARLAGRS
jgi:steroid delta-isomerase-like uncharacterized protein